MNRTVKLLLLSIPIVLIIIIFGHLYWLKSLNGNEQFSADTFLDSVTNKTALIVVAHDDDAIGCAGTISELTKKGWKVHFLTFYGHWRKQDNPIRKKEVERVAEIQRLSTTTLLDFSLQRSDTVREPWLPIPYAQFPEYMDVDSLRRIIAFNIQKYKPSVLFTLDNVIGGYGHPEHVCVSQTALSICEEKMNVDDFSVLRIYQAVFPRTLNENVLRNNPAFIAAKQVYKADGSPDPTVEISIYNSSREKKQVMLAYKSQERNLVKIWPYYNVYPHWLYFWIFDKEYFRTIVIKS